MKRRLLGNFVAGFTAAATVLVIGWACADSKDPDVCVDGYGHYEDC